MKLQFRNRDPQVIWIFVQILFKIFNHQRRGIPVLEFLSWLKNYSSFFFFIENLYSFSQDYILSLKFHSGLWFQCNEKLNHEVGSTVNNSASSYSIMYSKERLNYSETKFSGLIWCVCDIWNNRFSTPRVYHLAKNEDYSVHQTWNESFYPLLSIGKKKRKRFLRIKQRGWIVEFYSGFKIEPFCLNRVILIYFG